ncbi:hypothetical protein [Saccharopolyspora halophila]|uniref:hypothetical protein n=1 Tax=Saccharopolyspora halophila TaxID=405551 RepID=UPI0031CFC578
MRVFVVGERVIAFRVHELDPGQLRVDPDAVVVERVELPDGLGDKLFGLCSQWGLDVAGFDLMRVADEWVFREVDVNCDWQWFEQRAESSEVSDAVHDWIRYRFGELVASAAGDWNGW